MYLFVDGGLDGGDGRDGLVLTGGSIRSRPGPDAEDSRGIGLMVSGLIERVDHRVGRGLESEQLIVQGASRIHGPFRAAFHHLDTQNRFRPQRQADIPVISEGDEIALWNHSHPREGERDSHLDRDT